MLMPVLARLADEYQGKFFLAKVDTDREQELAARYGVRSLPTVKLFKNGEVVEEFLGAQPERTVRDLIDRHAPRPSDALVAEAQLALTHGQSDQAVNMLARAVEMDPANDRAKLKLAELHLQFGRWEEGERLLGSLSRESKADPLATALFAKLEFARIAASAPTPPDLERTVAANPENHEALYQLSAHKVLQGDFESALDLLLRIVRRDRRFRDDAARKAMLSIFNLLGGKGDTVKKYRTLLSMALN